MELLKLFGLNKTPSKEVAKDRLHLILIHDRAALAPEILDELRKEIFNVISKYVEVDSSEVEIGISRINEGEGTLPALVANIPIRKAKLNR